MPYSFQNTNSVRIEETVCLCDFFFQAVKCHKSITDCGDFSPLLFLVIEYQRNNVSNYFIVQILRRSGYCPLYPYSPPPISSMLGKLFLV